MKFYFEIFCNYYFRYISIRQNGVEDDNLEIQEGASTIKEHIFLDKIKGIQIYHTDDHNGLKAVTQLIDSNFVRQLHIF